MTLSDLKGQSTIANLFSARCNIYMMPGFPVEEGGGMEKLVIVAISLILLIFYILTVNT